MQQFIKVKTNIKIVLTKYKKYVEAYLKVSCLKTTCLTKQKYKIMKTFMYMFESFITFKLHVF